MAGMLAERIMAIYNRASIRYTIFISFTITALIAIVMTGVTFYLRFSNQLENTLQSENQMLVEQVSQSLNDYLRNMIHLSDTLNYQVIKNAEIPSLAVNEQLQLLYDSNSNYIKNIAVFSADGTALVTAPPAIRREKVDVAQELWFQRALEQTENLHFSTPTVQTLFMDAGNQYSWILTLSSFTEITQNKRALQGVLLIDLKYSAIAELFKNVSLTNNGYVYLVDSDGTLLFHPQHQLIATGLIEEENLPYTSFRDGNYSFDIRGEKCSVIVRTVGYTGWSVIGVIPQRGLTLNSRQNILFILILLLLYFAIIILVNAYISNKLTDPIKNLELSVQQLERDRAEADIYVGGSQEIQHLGRSIQQMVLQLRQLTNDIVAEQTQKQKSELNALQAQINPHFLYNTLDILVWMIEKNQPGEALKIVSALARFFRLSLSKGKNIIPVQDELEHARNYLMIQQMRYKNKFLYTIEADEGALRLTTIKLVLQPIIENAIYHSMEFMMDGEGEIHIRAHVQDGDLYMSVQDNGLGMPLHVVDNLLTKTSPSSMGSGIGLKNVHERIILYFGREYGVMIHSEPDEGTCITLHMPAVPYEEMEDNL